MSEKRGRIAECRAVAKSMIGQLEFTLGINEAVPATMKLLEFIATLERLDNEIVEGGAV